jgi:hypothetical protein
MFFIHTTKMAIGNIMVEIYKLSPDSVEYKVGSIFIKQPFRLGETEEEGMLNLQNPQHRKKYLQIVRSDLGLLGDQLISLIPHNKANQRKIIQEIENHYIFFKEML